jgi:hypothetical protein
MPRANDKIAAYSRGIDGDDEVGRRDLRGLVLISHRKEAYQRLDEIDARRLKLSGYGLAYIAGRANTTTHHVRRRLNEIAARDADLALQGHDTETRSPPPHQ